MCAEPEWITDGNYIGSISHRLEYADTVIVVEKPRWLCVVNVLRRTLGSLGKTRPDVAEGCPERFNLAFIAFIWGFRARFDDRVRPMLATASEAGERVIFARNASDL
jgi:adenylate kinase family enzyme